MRITLSSGQTPKWSSMPVSYWINEKGSPNILNGSDFAAVQASFQTWQNVQTANIQFFYRGTTSTGTVGLDGMNVVTFTDSSTPLGSSIIAATFSFFTTNNDEFVFRESDIAVNPALNLSTSGEINKFDIQSIVTHEVGHLLGLDHSALVSSVMVPFGMPSQLDQRTLAYDDIAGVTEIYPNPSAMPATGQIQGTIQSGAGPIFGAHVVAVDSSGTAVTSTLSQHDGSYIIRFLQPNTYRIFAEPLDGPVTVQNILGGTNRGFYSGMNANFGTTYFGNVSTLDQATVLDVGPNGNATADIQTLPAATSGLNLTRPAFAIRIPRGQTITLSGIGGVDISDGIVFSASNPGLQFGPMTFGGRISSTAPTSVSVDLTVPSSIPLGPKNLAVNRGTDASVVAGAVVITDSPPSNISATPASGPVEGGTLVTIQGTNFHSGAQVYFAGLSAIAVQVIDSNTVQATVPANTPGPANIVVVNPDGTWGVGAQIFNYTSNPPVIHGVSPSSGPPATQVMIQGDHFDSRTQNIQVQFNGVSAPVISASTNAITAVVPFGATTGPVTVSIFGQTATGPAFTVTAFPPSTNLASSSFNFVDASSDSGGAVLTFSNNDDAIAPVTLPFNFVLFRDVYIAGSPVSVAINGYLSLASLSSDEFQHAPLPSTTVTRVDGSTGIVPPALIAPFWDDLIMHTNSAITTRTVGTAPNRLFIVEWSNMSVLDENGQDLNSSLTFEAVLYEGSNDIQFVYRSMSGPRSDGSSSTIGAQNLKRDSAVQTGFNQPIVSSGNLTTLHFQNGTYVQVPSVVAAEVQIIPAAPQSGEQFTGIVFLAPAAMSVVLKAMDANGNLITGPGIFNPTTIALAANQQYAKLVSELFGLQSFDGWIEADASAAGLGIFVATGSWDMQHLDGIVPRKPSTDFVLFHKGASAILVNPSPREAAVTFTEFGTGRIQSLSFPPQSRIVSPLTGAMHVQSSEALAAMERSEVSGGLTSNAAVAASEAQSSLVFPDAVIGAGYGSTLTVANLGTETANLTISFGSTSAPLQVNTNTVAQVSIASLLSLPADSLQTGAVRVAANSPSGSVGSSSSLVGVLDIETQTDGATIAAHPVATDFTFGNVDNGNGLFTGLAFASGNAPAKITIDVHPAHGGTSTSGTINLDANQQRSGLLNSLVPASANQVGGYVRIHSDQPIWVWEIYGSSRAVASAPPF
jgi:Matrixin/IPT/TIG domain